MVTSLYLMPTSMCNLKCSYCYCPGNGIHGDPDLFISIAESFTEHIRSNSVSRIPQIRFTGGEPWLEKELLPAITGSFLERVPHGWVVINTNATVLPEARLMDFRGNDRLIHVVSLDGPPALHDSRRKTAAGHGTFSDVVNGIKMLLDLDLPVYLNSVLDTESSAYLPDLMDIVLSEFGLSEISLSLLYRDADPMTPDERFGLLRNAYSEASSRSIRLGGHHRLLLGNLIPELNCRAGITTALVDPDGMVHACQRFVGRSEPDCVWTEKFDWSSFNSVQKSSHICGGKDDRAVGRKLFELYNDEYPEYLDCHPLDRILFGVLS